MTESHLFKPLQIGAIQVQYHIRMALLTRRRTTPDRIPILLMKEYYTQYISEPGILIIIERILKEITNMVYIQGSFIYIQLFGMGRAADLEVAVSKVINIITLSTILILIVVDFTKVVQNTHTAGFDSVENISNQRDNEYGGSIRNQSRLLYKFTDIINRAGGSELAYLSLVETRIYSAWVYNSNMDESHETLNFTIKHCDEPILIAGGYGLDKTQKLIDKQYPNRDIVVLFGRHFI
ncbi:FMN-linked oxidoreductase [Aspergillus saccharolyticus JOP 1030-1]|uniref:FMN-linked oxidoreductase n=1 Tax=Aspergillus saccharolyticus JOP 1030-1 TaxID=1450539 RepID=A0A318Z5B0_9EURO|nr:FMN-linked oxidoreductase [Aspergillus saccharolyticus JOP 1030-1]PYH41634.1 FMN-linked oxidoreductase [Aspergillus saccharolyticus JOP 1030-1]